jgi:hypothetical protein
LRLPSAQVRERQLEVEVRQALRAEQPWAAVAPPPPWRTAAGVLVAAEEVLPQLGVQERSWPREAAGPLA